VIYPSISSLMNHADSKYTLAVMTAKRARQLTEGAPKLVNCDSQKAVSIAIHEIDSNKIKFIRTKSGIK